MTETQNQEEDSWSAATSDLHLLSAAQATIAVYGVEEKLGINLLASEYN
jgi:hypothetical protein